MAIVGIGIYRDRLALADFLSLSLMSLWFFFTISIIHCISHVGLLIGLFLLNGIDLYLYGLFIYKSLITALKLEEMFSSTGEYTMILRLEMVIQFGGYVVVWMAIVATVSLYVWISPTWQLRKQLLEELCLVALFSLDMYMFTYRNNVRSDIGQDELLQTQEETLAEETMIWLTEPDNAYFAYLSHSPFNNNAVDGSG
jgi:hypothetical protein